MRLNASLFLEVPTALKGGLELLGLGTLVCDDTVDRLLRMKFNLVQQGSAHDEQD